MKRWLNISMLRARVGLVSAVLFFLFWQLLPAPLFDEPHSFVLSSREGKLLGATIAEDGQWRFPEIEELPGFFEKSIIAFEDKRFYQHPGVDVLALGRAFYQNVRAGEVRSGGSTLTMQTIRLMRKNQPRTIWEKLKEVVLAVRLEMGTTKPEILNLYASYAPFGGNVVGLEAASWRYFGKPPAGLSWAEAACLAVLPNSPSLVRPGKNQSVYYEKRNRLLDRLANRHIIKPGNLNLYRLEPLPGEPYPLPQLAPHLLQRAKKEHVSESLLSTTIHFGYQKQLNKILAIHQSRLAENGVHNAAALVTNVATGEVLAYTGNIRGIKEEYSPAVDIIDAPRSSGSVLKPILYAAMLQKGEVLPNQLVPDVPTYFGNFHPQNYTERYLGAVSARSAIALSLNVPSVLMLNDHGIPVFHHELRSLGMSTLDQPPGHYGLSLILGGAEVKVWDLAGMYGSLARVLKNYNRNRQYFSGDIHAPVYAMSGKPGPLGQKNWVHWDAGAIYQALEAMVNVRRPEAEAAWRHFGSSQTIAWKTGTSFGSRDAWAVGITPKFVVTVWAGNADGEGRSGISGLQTAAPILFDIFNFLPKSGWFEAPHGAFDEIRVCGKSGYKAGEYCGETEMMKVTELGAKGENCPYHQRVYLTMNRTAQVYKNCIQGKAMDTTWFNLPSAMAWYYKQWHPMYTPVPSFHQNCRHADKGEHLSILYPRPAARIKIPKALDGNRGQVVAEATIGDGGDLYWHLDESYIGKTSAPHQLAITPKAGKHKLIVEDISGQRQMVRFEVVAD